MFLATADQNYIIARWAALNDLYLDFFWMGLHAVEKYLKAFLLFNGESAICYGTTSSVSLEPCWGCIGCFPGVNFKNPILSGLGWRDETISAYITRLNRHGDPNNPYLTSDFDFRSEGWFGKSGGTADHSIEQTTSLGTIG